ncbi:MAG: hypothetical protein IT547_04575 [Hyphomonadaceae bacterium]|nr:hypothetical protein [Hyphomonadaceae bacterium]
MKLHLGQIEPHAPLLRAPPESQLLYKVMKAEHLIASIASGYLHFNRVDRYSDFPGADPHDGEQLPADLAANQAAAIGSERHWTLADYYEQARARTYACCFSLENSKHIWADYAVGAAYGKVCVVFAFGKLKQRLNDTLSAGARMVLPNQETADQIFSVNYGMIDYVDRAVFRANHEFMQNPIVYTFLKDAEFAPDQELRISLSALGIGKFVLRDRSELQFGDNLQLGFDFRGAIGDGTISGILAEPGGDNTYLVAELAKLHIGAEGTAVPSPKV